MFCWLTIFTCLVSPAIAFAQDVMFETLEAYTLPDKMGQLDVHAEYFRRKNVADIKMNGNLLTAPVITYSLGLGEIGEIWMRFQSHRWVNDNTQNINRSGISDVVFYSKIRFLDEKNYFPAMAFAFGVKGPAANPPLGSDEADFFAIAAASKSFGATEIHMNLGVGILGDPNRNQSQLHTVIYRFSAKHSFSPNLQLGLEIDSRIRVSGAWYELGNPANDPINRASVGLGAYYSLNQNDRIGIKLTRGLITESEKYGFLIGYEHRLDFSAE